MATQFDPAMSIQFPFGTDDLLATSRRDSDFTATDFLNEELDQIERSSCTNLTNDTVFQDIRDQMDLNKHRGSLCTVQSEDSSKNENAFGTKMSDNFTSISFGIQPRATYEHNKKNTDIIGITYNGRMRQFIILDAKGITIWKKDLLEQNVFRTLMYPKFEYRVITNLVYAKKHNVYFALGKDFSLKVLNRDFEETCRVASDLRSVLFMIFNPVRDELITGGVGGTKIWRYHQVSEKTWTEIKPMANYRLKLQCELPNVGGSWVKRVELDLTKQHLYCCSETDLFAYNMDGQEVFRFERAHNMSITGCAFSLESNLLVTASIDTEVKAWSLGGGLVHTFRGHSRAVSSLILHPNTSSIVLTASLDGSLRMWSLNTMECLYSIVVSTEGLLWMGFTDDNLLYLGTMRTISVWSLNRFTTFWATTRSRLSQLRLVTGENKSTRVLSVCLDNSLRVFCRKTNKNLSTVLPPPSLSPLDSILEVAYNRVVNIIHVLINSREILLYTVRTDPACMVTVWDTLEIQNEIIRSEQEIASETSASQKRNNSLNFTKRALTRATQYGQGNETVCQCHSICYLNAYVMMYTEEGPCTPLQDNYLLMGLEDGRILFMDPVVRAKKYFQFRANKEAIVHMEHDREHGCLWTQCHLGDAMLIQIWLLPQLELRHEVYCPPDVTGSVRLGTAFITSHKSGSVIHHHLQDIDDMGVSVYRPRFGVSDFSSRASFTTSCKADHNGPVFSIDACHKLGLFCTASDDGTVKIWESTKTLLTEIILDATLCAAMFFNQQGDILIGFKNHIFHIDHSKVCPTVKAEAELTEDYPESDIQEDPSILYEGVAENPDPLDLNNYLVPFNIDFCQDYLEGKVKVDPKEQELFEDSSAESSIASAAPTAIYQSPHSTPQQHLSLVDLTLSNEVTDHDLHEYMHKMQPELGRDHLAKKMGVLFDDEFKKRKRSPKHLKELNFEMPKFGISPGPTPTPSPPSSIDTPSNFDVSSGGESTPVDSEEEVDDQTSFKPIEPASESTPPEKVIVPKPSEPQQTETIPSSRLKLIKIDSRGLLKESRKSTAEKYRPDSSQMKTITESIDQAKPRPPGLKRKEGAVNRRRPQARKTQSAKQVSLQSEDDSCDDSDSGIKRTRTIRKKTVSHIRKQPGISDAKSDDEKQLAQMKPLPQETEKTEGESPMRVGTSPTGQVAAPATEPGMTSPAHEPKDITSSVQEIGDSTKTSLSVSKVNVPLADRVGSSLSQLKVGFHDDLHSGVSPDHEKVHSLSLSEDASKTGSKTSSRQIRPGAGDDLVTKQTQRSGERPPGGEQLSTMADRQSRSQQERTGSPTTTIVSDYGSDWTVAAEDHIHIDRTYPEDGTSDIPGWHRATRSAVSIRRHHTPTTEPVHPRPHTALVLPADKEELEKMYNKALQQYESEGNPNQIYRNDGTTFENYHNKLIERHQLLRLQRQLRLKSAEERRRQLSLEKQERNEHILTRSGSSLGRGKSCPESAFALYDRSTSSSPVHMPKVPSVYISTRHVESHKFAMTPSSHGDQYCSYHKELSRTESPSAFSGTTAGTGERYSPRSSQRMMKSLLKSERPFRMRLHPQKPSHLEPKTAEKVDISLLDPRNPAALKQHSSKSIPSKCTRYVLITNAKDDASKIIPTPLEEQLIMERFPDRMERWLTGYPRSPRTYHGFPSSYLKALALDKKALLQSIANSGNKAC